MFSFESAKSALPDLESTISVKGLTNRSKILRDKWGIPHIYAENEWDAFFTQGFATAQDRLFQMDYDRYRCLGRSAEFAGLSGVEADKLMCKRNLAQIAKEDYNLASQNAKDMLDAFAAGVNAFIQTTKCLPVEYQLLNTEPELFKAWHCVAIYKVRNTAEGNFGSKLWITKLNTKLGPQKTSKLLKQALTQQLITIPPGEMCRVSSQGTIDELYQNYKNARLYQSQDGESNAWVVSGKLSTTGMPLLAGDSHRILDTPNVYMQIHIVCNSINVLGYTIPGWPGVLHFCHNTHTAWGMTHGMGDTQDLFVEQFRHTSNGNVEYRFRDKWLKTHKETKNIRIKGNNDQQINVFRTHHGPIVTGEPMQGEGISLAEPGAKPTRWIDGAYKAMKSRGADDFEESMDLWTDRTNNYVYMDKSGNFGYKFAGLVPMRNTNYHNFSIVKGYTGENEWQGYIPRNKLPRLRNPSKGWVVTCNQRVTDHTYPYHISSWWATDYRAQRITKWIQNHQGHISPNNIHHPHADSVSIPAKTLQKAFRMFINTISNDHAKSVAHMLVDWNAKMDKESQGAAAYASIRIELIKAVLYANIGSIAEESLQVGNHSAKAHINRFVLPLIIDAIEQNNADIFSKNTISNVLDRSAQKAYSRLAELLGSDTKEWLWGNIHLTKHMHPLSVEFPSAAHILNPPSVPTSGDCETPLAGSHGSDFLTTEASVNRYSYDVSNWSSGRWIVPLGASGHCASPHYTDQQKAWANVDTIPQLWEYKDVMKNVETQQILIPRI